MSLWLKLPIVTKIIAIGCVIIALFTVLIFTYILPSMEQSILNKKKEKLDNIISSVISTAEAMDNEASSGNITIEEAQTRIKFIVRNLRYGEDKKDYVWINDFTPVMIAHPFSPELEGKEVSGMTDKDPKTPIHLFTEFVRISNESDTGGFLTYTWQWKDDASKIVPKLSFVKPFKKWNWIFGTGIYIEDFKAEIFMMKRNLIILSLGALLFSLFLIFIVARTISKGIKLLETNLKTVKEGDLTIHIKNRYRDEIGHMILSFNELTRRMKDILIEVINTVETLSSSSVEMSASADSFSRNSQTQAAASEQITATIEEISGGIENIADEISDQLSKVETIQININSHNSELQKINDELQNTKRLTGEITTVTKAGENSLRMMSENMHKINTSSQEMRNIVGIINDISDRINLLSLNASIEAARAGDSGRGFAVVADEISKLADQTAHSIKEIGERINENESEIGKFSINVDGVLKLLNSIVEGIVEINSMTDGVASTMLSGLESNNKISEDFSIFKKRAEIITTATAEQKIAIDEMVKSVSEISMSAQSTASSSEEIAAGAEELSGMAEMLKAKVEYFNVRENK